MCFEGGTQIFFEKAAQIPHGEVQVPGHGLQRDVLLIMLAHIGQQLPAPLHMLVGVGGVAGVLVVGHDHVQNVEYLRVAQEVVIGICVLGVPEVRQTVEGLSKPLVNDGVGGDQRLGKADVVDVNAVL